MSAYSVSSAFAAALIKQGRAAGIEVEDALAAARMKLDVREDADERHSVDDIHELWVQLHRVSTDPVVGLHLAEHYARGQFASMDYLFWHSENLGVALGRLAKFSRLLHDGIHLDWHRDDDGGRLSWKPLRGAPRHFSEWVVASLITVARQMISDDWAPTAVTFVHNAPLNLSEHERVLGVTPRFDAVCTSLTIAAADLEVASRMADPGLAAVMGRYVAKLADELPEAIGIGRKVQQAIAATLEDGRAKLEDIAEHLRMRPRTLQRRLRASGIAYQSLLDDTRKERSLALLVDHSPQEVAKAVGFTDVPAFHRAFKRWTGLTPTEYRRLHGYDEPS